jgi:Chaperone of endosialidase
MNPLIQLKTTIPVFLVVLVCFGLSLSSRAVSPPPDGGYPGANTAEGTGALFSRTTGTYNTAVGFYALRHNTSGSSNTAIGSGALNSNQDGGANTAMGSGALTSNLVGGNTAVGAQALNLNELGGLNTATGYFALALNVNGNQNTAIGGTALYANVSGNQNTATGFYALSGNETGSSNTADGTAALFNCGGSKNTATGAQALQFNNEGSENTAVGNEALRNKQSGSNNIALGSLAGQQLNSGSNNIYIGALGAPSESDTIRIGKTQVQTTVYMQGIYGATVASGTGTEVFVDSSGHLGTVTSSARFKNEIQPMHKASEAILALKPVTFRYKREIDPDGVTQFGLVAEDVERVNPQLVVRDKEGKPYTVRYDAVNAMLLNEFLKEHRKVEQQEATIVQLKKDLQATAAHQRKQIEALTAGLQKVSAQVELGKPAPQTTLNNH